ATALGKTNMSATTLEHYGPHSVQEAMTVLEYLPGQRSAIATLATSFNSTNFSELTPSQREKLRGLAFVRATGVPGYDRDVGLRLVVRGGWPEFRALALARLTNGSPQDLIHAANALAWSQSPIGAAHVPLVSALARTNMTDNIIASFLSILQRAGPAGTNA